MTEYTTPERWYRVEHRVSGFDAGLWRADSPEEAIARMMAEAGGDYADEPSPDWIATEVQLVQMIHPAKAADGFVQPWGEPEVLDDHWMTEVLTHYRVTLVGPVTGWGDPPYTAMLRLDYTTDLPCLYYLVPDDAVEALTEPDETLARLGLITCAVGHFTDPTDCKQYPAGCKACYEDGEGGEV